MLNDVIEIVNANITGLEFSKKYDAVITNPPYKKKETGINSKNQKQLISRFEMYATLDEWIKTSARLLKHMGSFYMVYRVDRLTELICILDKYKLEVKRIRFVYSKESEQSNLVLIKAVKCAKKFLKVEKPLIIYNEDGTYTNEIMEIYKKDYMKD